MRQVRLNVLLLRRNLSICEFVSCATNSSRHKRLALSSAADALVSLPKPNLTGMNFPNCARKNSCCGEAAKEKQGGTGRGGTRG